MSIHSPRSRRQVLAGLAGTAAAALPQTSFGQTSGTMTVASHVVHRNVLRSGPAGDLTASWRAANATNLEWLTLDIGPLNERLFREASLRRTQVGVGLLYDVWGSPANLARFEPLNAFQDSNPIEDFSDIAPNMVKQLTVDGRMYAIPFRQAIGGVHFNNALLEKAGLSGGPKTIEQFAEYARKLTYVREDGAQVHGFTFDARNYGTACNIARAWGGTFITQDYKVVTDQPAMIKTFELLRDLYEVGVIPRNFATLTQEDHVSMLRDGRLGLAYMPFPRTTLLNDPKASRFAGQFGVVRPPASNTMPGAAIGIVEYWSMVIPANSTQKELAWSFIRDMSSKATHIGATLNGNSPTRVSTYDDPSVKQRVSYSAEEAATLATAISPCKAFDRVAEATDIFAEEMQLCIIGKSTPKEAGTRIAERVHPLLPKA